MMTVMMKIESNEYSSSEKYSSSSLLEQYWCNRVLAAVLYTNQEIGSLISKRQTSNSDIW